MLGHAEKGIYPALAEAVICHLPAKGSGDSEAKIVIAWSEILLGRRVVRTEASYHLSLT